MLSKTLCLGLGKADIFQSKLGLFSAVSLPLFSVHNKTGISFLKKNPTVKIDNRKKLILILFITKS